MWSPETLILILQLSVILYAGVLIISFISSLSNLRMTLRRHGALLAGAAGIIVVSMAAYGLSTPAYADPDTAGIDESDRIVVAEVAPFGMASRKPVAVPPAPSLEPATAAGATADLPLYSVHCAACHGPDGNGVEGLGVNLVSSKLVRESDSAELILFLQQGRMPDDEGSVSGRPMPAFAWMQASELNDLAAFLQEKAASSGD